MDSGAYTVEVTGLSPKATEKDVAHFFAFSGAVEHIEIIRSAECSGTAYVTFKDAYSVETAALLSGATIVDQRVCITRWGQHEDEYGLWGQPSRKIEDETSSTGSQSSVPSAGEAVAMAQDVVKAMLAKGYVLGKDALSKAKAFDESHQVSATAATKVSELSERIGFTGKVFAGVEAVKFVDARYHVSDTTKSAVSAAANTVINSSYFSKGAFWLSGALTRAAKAASDLGSHGVNK